MMIIDDYIYSVKIYKYTYKYHIIIPYSWIIDDYSL